MRQFVLSTFYKIDNFTFDITYVAFERADITAFGNFTFENLNFDKLSLYP
jgi:hypothetical protein